jgi:hypothetical protein
MRIAVCTLIFLLVVSCKKEDVDKRIPTFDERETLKVLTAVKGTLQYYCESDTSFVYLKPDDEDLPPLLIDGQSAFKYMQSWFNIWHGDYCQPVRDLYIQDPQLRILISGDLKEKLNSDSLLANKAMPFVVDTLIKVKECAKVHNRLSGSYPFQDTKWSLVEMIDSGDTLRPTCEYNNTSIAFSSELFDDDSDYYNLENPFEFIDQLGTSSACFYYYTFSQDSITIGGTTCTLGIGFVTRDMDYLAGRVYSALGIHENNASLAYIIEDNYLNILSSNTNRLLFVAKE